MNSKVFIFYCIWALLALSAAWLLDSILPVFTVVLFPVVVRDLRKRGIADVPSAEWSWANLITLARVLMLSTVVLLDVHPRWVAYGVALFVVLDGLDGWIARRTRPTKSGAFWDSEADALGVLIVSVFLVVVRQLDWLILIVGSLRYLAGIFNTLTSLQPRRKNICRFLFVVQIGLLAGAAASNIHVANAQGMCALIVASISFIIDYVDIADQKVKRCSPSIFLPFRAFVLSLFVSLPVFINSGMPIFVTEIWILILIATLPFVWSGRVLILSLLGSGVFLFLLYDESMLFVLRRESIWAGDLSLLQSGAEFVLSFRDRFVSVWAIFGLFLAFLLVYFISVQWRSIVSDSKSGFYKLTTMCAVFIVSSSLWGRTITADIFDGFSRFRGAQDKIESMRTGSLWEANQSLDKVEFTQTPDIWMIVLESYGASLLKNDYLKSRFIPALKKWESETEKLGWEMSSRFSVSPIFGGGSFRVVKTPVEVVAEEAFRVFFQVSLRDVRVSHCYPDFQECQEIRGDLRSKIRNLLQCLIKVKKKLILISQNSGD